LACFKVTGHHAPGGWKSRRWLPGPEKDKKKPWQNTLPGLLAEQ
jgi:hypothetical protein